MQRIRRKRTVLRLAGGELILKGLFFDQPFAPIWRGALPMAGPAVMTVSVLELSGQSARTIHEKSSQHLLLHDADVFPLVGATWLVTSRCNLRCRFCKRELIERRDRGHTPPEVVDAVVEASRNLASVQLHADGEPLLNPFLPDILTRLKQTMPRFGKVGLLTNGMQLDQGTARDLVDRGLDWLAVSMDGASKATMEAIRRGSRFERIVQNVAYAVEYGRQNAPAGIDFCIVFTTHAENLHEIPAMVRLAGQLGVPHLTVGHLIRFETGKYEPQPRELLAPLLEEARGIGLREGVTLQAQPLEPSATPQCPFLDVAVVNVSGDVAFCNLRNPSRPGEPIFTVGNVKERSLHEIWDSEPVRDLRRRIAAADFPSQCQPCCYSQWGSPVKL